MKKLFKIFLGLLPMAMLVSCASVNAEANVYQANEPAATSAIDTYLVLTANGLYEGHAGTKYSDLFLENTYKFTANPGDSLPGKDKITSTVEHVEFVSWISYENKGKPTVYDKVPEKKDSILYAFFKNTAEPKPEEGGNNPGPDTNPDTDPDVTEKITIYANDTSWSKVNVYAWTGDVKNKDWPGEPMVKDGDHWKYELDTKYENLIFNNGSGAQTSDLNASDISNTNNCFHIDHKSWGKLDDKLAAAQTKMVYCNQKPVAWANDIYCYAWGSNGSNAAWPGVKMVKKDNYWEYKIPEGYSNIIFTDGKGDGTKTSDLTYSFGQDSNCYHLGKKAWGTLDELIEQDDSLPKSEFYLAGKGSFIPKEGEENSNKSIIFYENTNNKDETLKEYVAFNVELKKDDEIQIKSSKSETIYSNFTFDLKNAMGKGQIGQLPDTNFAKVMVDGTYTFYFRVYKDTTKTPTIWVN